VRFKELNESALFISFFFKVNYPKCELQISKHFLSRFRVIKSYIGYRNIQPAQADHKKNGHKEEEER
jgi:hypothetical protein